MCLCTPNILLLFSNFFLSLIQVNCIFVFKVYACRQMWLHHSDMTTDLSEQQTCLKKMCLKELRHSSSQAQLNFRNREKVDMNQSGEANWHEFCISWEYGHLYHRSSRHQRFPRRWRCGLWWTRCCSVHNFHGACVAGWQCSHCWSSRTWVDTVLP